MASNTSVFRGSDGSIVLAVDTGAEGDLAKGIIESYSLTPIGRVTGVEVHVDSDVQAFHELGQRYPTELRSGNVNVSGSIARAFINGALLKLLLGDAAASRPAGAFVNPSFNISLRAENPARAGISSTVTIHGVKIDEWSYSLPEDDFVMEQVTFKGLWISVEDAQASA